MKTLLNSLPLLALLLCGRAADAQQTRTVLKQPPNGAIPNALLEPLATGANAFTISASGTLVFSNGFTLSGGDYLKTALTLNAVPNVDATNMDNASGGTLAQAFGGLGEDVSSASGLVSLDSGAVSFTPSSVGGFGSADSGKVPVFDSGGALTGAAVIATTGSAVGTLKSGSLEFFNSAHTLKLKAPSSIAGNYDLNLPNISSNATLISTNDIGTSGAKIPLLNAANTFSAAQIMTAPVNGAGLTIGGSLAGGGVTRSVLTISDNWSAATGNTSAPTLLSLEIADVGGDPNYYGARALRVLRNGTENFYIDHGGSMFVSGGVRIDGNYQIVEMPVAYMLRWSNQTALSRAADGIILQRSESGTIAQTLRVANTVSSATSWEAGVFDWQAASNTLRIGSDVGSGGGTARDVKFIRGGMVKVTIGADTTAHEQPVKLTSYIVSSLPSAATCGAGSMAFVTDATATTAYATVAGGGSNKVLVISDGTNWVIH